MTTFVRWSRRYKEIGTRRTSPSLYGIVPERVTVKRDFVVGAWSTLDTLFEEIEVLPWTTYQPPAVRPLFDCPEQTTAQSPESFGKTYMHALEQVLEAIWKPKRFHVIAQSSDYDSRILSLAIGQIANRLGPDWLGDVLFICSEWEAPSFLTVMDLEGWRPEQYIVYRSKHMNNTYWEEALDPKQAWRSFNGVRSFIFNGLYFPVADAVATQVIPDDPKKVQMFGSPLSFLERMLRPSNSATGALGRYVKSLYKYQSTYLPGYFPIIACQAAADLLKLSLESSVRLGIRTSEKIVEICSPRVASVPILHDLRRVSVAYRSHPIRTLTKKGLACAVTTYESSWYGQNVAPEAVQQATRSLGYSDWWSRWSSAIICEHLIEEGCKIVIRD